AKVKADTGEELVAPRPVMHLLPASSISNAWVTAVPACVPWKVRRTGATADGAGGSSANAGQGGAAGGGSGEGGAGATGGTGGAPAPAETQPILFNHYGKRVQELGGSAEAGACIPREDFAPFADTFLKEWNAGTP